MQEDLLKKAPFEKNGEPDLNLCTKTPIDTTFIDCFMRDSSILNNNSCVYAKIARKEKNKISDFRQELKNYQDLNNLQILLFNEVFPGHLLNYGLIKNKYEVPTNLKNNLDDILIKIENKYKNSDELLLFMLLYTNKDRNLPKLENLMKNAVKNDITAWFNSKKIDFLFENLDGSNTCVWDRLILLHILEKHYYFECGP